MSRSDRIAGSLNQSVHIRHSLLGDEVIHLVIHEKAEPLDRDKRSEAAVQGGGHRNCVACFINYRVVRGVLRFGNVYGSKTRLNVQFIEGVDGTLHLLADGGSLWIQRLTPGRGVLLVD